MMEKETKNSLYWAHLEHEHWDVFIAATKVGVSFVGSQKAGFEELEKWATKRLPNYRLEEDKDMLKPYLTQLVNYFRAQNKEFSIELELHGTPFQQTVWKELQKIKYGQTVSYSDIAERIKRPSSVRAIASAIGANPILIIIPCHRVIGKNGKLSGYRGGLEMKKELLELEKNKLLCNRGKKSVY